MNILVLDLNQEKLIRNPLLLTRILIRDMPFICQQGDQIVARH